MIDKVVIEAGRSEKHYWSATSKFRELFYILSWRDIKVRYKQTVIGAAWSILRPLLTMIVFTFIFSKIAKIPPGMQMLLMPLWCMLLCYHGPFLLLHYLRLVIVFYQMQTSFQKFIFPG